MKSTAVAQQEPNVEVSPISSRTSSPDSQRRSSRQDSIGSSMSGGSNFSTPQINFLQKQRELREQQHMPSSSAASSPCSPQSQSVYSADKPPIPPRGLPPPVPQRHISVNNETTSVTLRQRSGENIFWVSFFRPQNGLNLF